MHYKTNRLNHDFQILHFIVGSCHTPDGAYAILCDLQEDRSNALKNNEAAVLREQAKRIRAQRKVDSVDEADRLEGQADLAEIEAFAETVAKNLAAAKAELAFIEKCMARLEPHRKYKDLPLPEAHQAAQAEEWKLELIHRAENFLITSGTIPSEHFATMRLHPEFKTAILPAVEQMRSLLLQGAEGHAKLLQNAADRTQSLPLLLK